MLDELRARFKLRFLVTARARLARTRAPDVDMGAVAAELHSLAGEAALLEFTECAGLARAAERHARAGELRSCRESLDAIERALDAIAE
jgi:hypothetical protein